MKNINKILFGIILVLLVVVLILVALWYQKMNSASSYSAIYLDTGDVYFGKLSYFPSLTLNHTWYLQRDQSQGVALMDFSKAAWKPEGKIKINRDRVVWISKISQDSPIISVMLGKESMDENGLPQSQSQSTLSPTPSITPNP